MILDIVLDTSLDCLKMLPFLVAAFLIIEALEHYSSDFTADVLAKVGVAGPVVGALVGCIPQCGFSVMAANFYAGGVISVGTLLSVFVATSDEAVLIMMGNPDRIGDIGLLIAAKIVISITAGYIVDIFLKNKVISERSKADSCRHCGCEEKETRIIRPAWNHTKKVFIYIFVVTGILNLCINMLGIDRMSAFFLGDTIFQPMIASIIGLIPNCAASVILTELYLSGAISFASVVAGLCTGAGIGLVVLFRVNNDRRENFKIVGILIAVSVISGMVLQVLT